LSFGEVYEGVLQDGSMVAVKRLVSNVEEVFAKELKVHCEINHKNVVRLIGYCAEENALMMVTEYISKGNLNDVFIMMAFPSLWRHDFGSQWSVQMHYPTCTHRCILRLFMVISSLPIYF
jgi:serine/threonine protein kinase